MNATAAATQSSSRLDAYAAPRPTIVVIDPDSHVREGLSHVLSAAYQPLDFVDAATAAAALRARPAAALVGASTALVDGADPIPWLRRHPFMKSVPIILCTEPGRPGRGTQDGPNATFILPGTSRGLLDLVTRVGNKAVEDNWSALPAAPREALKRTLVVFNGVADLIGSGSAMDFKDVSHACTPIIDVVKQAGHHYVFEGLRNHNDHSYVHSLRMSTLLALFGHTIGLDENSLMTLASAGLVHDLGKTMIPPEVMEKAGPLTPQELEIAKSHVDVTIDYLTKHSNVPKAVIAVAGQHHERIDGSGYPLRLKGEQLNDLSRMAAIVDVFCALTERRPHRAAMGPFQALEVMQENIREKLDQRLVRMFSSMLIQATLPANA